MNDLIQVTQWWCAWCGRRVRDLGDHLPRCPALGRPKG